MLQQNILIVDDHPENLVALEAILDAEDRNLVKANSGQEALTLAVKMEFSLVLLDVQMPDMDGFEVASLMRKHKKTKSIPIIFVTAINKDQKYVFKGYESGAVDYLFKPLDPIILGHKVRFFLELDYKNKQLQRRINEVMQLKEDNELLLKSVGEAVIGVNTAGGITFVNPAATKIFNSKIDTLLGTNISDLLSYDEESDQPFIWPESSTYLKCSEGHSDKIDNNIYGIRDGKSFPAEFIVTPISRSDAPFNGAVFALRDITQRKEIENQLLHSARYDSLTGLVNRSYFETILENAITRARRNDTMVGLMFLDLDHFKEVNDTLGHGVGDSLLKEVSRRLSGCIREVDTLCRLGGDEFTLILESINTQEDIICVAEKLLNQLADRFYITENETVHEVHVGASIGLVAYPLSANNIVDLLKCADIAMYQAKTQGRNNYQVYSAHMESKMRRTLEIESRLRVAIEKDEFVLHYQAQVDSNTGCIVGVEALVRWEPKDQPAIFPDEFIPIAEETGLIVELGYWILARACADAQIIQKSCETRLTVSVNLSVRQLMNHDICHGVSAIIKDSGIDPKLLNLEITESMVMEDPEEKIAKLVAIKNLGVSISVDDFGTGYSSLSYIKKLPINTLKIDRAFVNDIGNDRQGEAITKTIINMAQGLDLNVIAEGVETIEQLTFLQGHHCSIVQGYYYCRPVPLQDFIALQKIGFPSANDDTINPPSNSAANS